MAGLLHVAVGFAARPLSKKAPVGVLILAVLLTDLLWIVFALTGIEKEGAIYWSHGLCMSAVLSIIAAVIAGLIYHSHRTGIFLGLLVFSHWLGDFITHPMGAVFGGRPLPPDLPLFFAGSPKVGLGLYNRSAVLAYAVEIGSFAIGVAVYVNYLMRKRRGRANQAAGRNAGV